MAEFVWLKGPMGYATSRGKNVATIRTVRLGNGTKAYQATVNGVVSNLPNNGVVKTLNDAKEIAEAALLALAKGLQ